MGVRVTRSIPDRGEAVMDRGFVHIYTGDGKGKTTAAIGLSIRAVGAGLRVWFGQFIKKGQYSEINALARFEPHLQVVQFGSGRFLGKVPSEDARHRAVAGLEEARQALHSGQYGVVVLDEILVTLGKGLIEEPALLDLLDGRPEAVELVLTGRGATAAVMERADLVTEMRAVKHYYEAGVPARRGIEK